LTGDDIAEIIVFAASRDENVVIADTLIMPNHQVRVIFDFRTGGIYKF
jgi:3-hydroxy acid dehydrogenase/malonic semialdehyde reductase